jgi:hypothetical protein
MIGLAEVLLKARPDIVILAHLTKLTMKAMVVTIEDQERPSGRWMTAPQ